MRKRSEIGKGPLQSVPSPLPINEAPPKPGMITCAKCGLEQPIASGPSDCLSCGATFVASTPVKHEVPPMENLGKLAFDLKEKDLDVTLAQLSAIVPEERRELQKWVDAKTADVTPRIRMILEHLGTVTPKPLAGAGSEPSDEIFKTDPAPVLDRGYHAREGLKIGIDMTKPGSKDETVDAGDEVIYVLGKEMYRVTDFCTFDVGPFSATTKVRANETRVDAINRLRVELEMVAEVDRVARRDSYIRTYLGIKPALQKAADAKKEG